MLFSSIFSNALFVSIVSCAALPETPTSAIEKRQSTTWVDNCRPPAPAPSEFKAFNLGGCQAQLTFSRGQNVGVQWEFDAIYADGSRVNYKPYRDFNNIAVSDPFYAIGYGNNYLTNSASSKAFTSVHEFSNVCRNGATPTAWIFHTTDQGGCQPKGYRYTTGQIRAVSGTRPARTTFSARQLDSAANIEVSWTPVSGAAGYAVLLRVPTGKYEDNSGYFVNYRGARVNAPATTFQMSGTASRRFPEEPRKLVVNVVNAQGVWSYTPDTKPVDVRVS